MADPSTRSPAPPSPAGFSSDFSSPHEPLGWDSAKQNRDRLMITEDDAKAVLSFYRLPAPLQSILWQCQHRLTESCLLRLRDGKTLFLKRHNARIRSLSGLSTEHHFMMFLAQYDLPVTPPYRTWQGRSLVWHGDGLYELFPTLNGPPFHGHDLYRDVPSWHPYHSVAHARAAGAMLARLHHISINYAAPARDELLLSSCQMIMKEDFPASLTQWLHHWRARWPVFAQFDTGTDNFKRIIEALMPWHRLVSPLLHHVKPCWGHGDWHGSNLAWRNNKPCQIFDFGMSNLTSAPFDLAVAIERCFITWLTPHSPQPVHYAQLEGFLEGYHTVRPIFPEDYALIAGFLPLCHVEFALAEIPYYHTLLNRPESTEVACNAYLIGHANWFSSPDGRALLHFLQNRGRI